MNYAHVQRSCSSVLVKQSSALYMSELQKEQQWRNAHAKGRGLGRAGGASGTAQRKVTTDHLQAGPYKTTWSDE